MSIILASKSPRRQELLTMLGVKFDICVSNADETIKEGQSPDSIVKELALKKAKAVKDEHAKQGDLVIGADTIVVCDNIIFGKPKDEMDAINMLTALSGKEHYVYSGIAVLSDNKEVFDSVKTKVVFKPLTRDEVERYVKTGEPMDKAGAYAIQGLSSIFIEGIEGDFYNVMGLPLFKLAEILKVYFDINIV